MWDAVVEKLKYLKALDPQYQVFGADNHRYGLRPYVSASLLETVEGKVGIALPTALKMFYQDVGNGIAGPYYGLYPAEALIGYRPSELYPGIDAFQQQALADGTGPDEEGYFEVRHEDLTGLIAIIEEGCGHQVCLVTMGKQAGSVVYVSCDGYVVETAQTLVDIYDMWLDSEIEHFEAVQALMYAGATYGQIRQEMQERFKDYRAADRMISIANVPKPEVLFGDRNRRILHGATQEPWYEQVLKEWQTRNL